MRIEVNDESIGPSWSASTIESLAILALHSEDAPEDSVISVTLVDAPEIERLNREYRGIDKPTDVLSFPMDITGDAEDRGAEAGEDEAGETAGETMLGDIVIAPAVASAQAPEYGNSFEDEMSLLLVHGCLHLLGYDHVEDAEAEVMEAHEREILSHWHEHGGASGSASAEPISELDCEHWDMPPQDMPSASDFEQSSYMEQRGEPRVREKFSYALQGVCSALRTERNLRIDAIAAIIALSLCIVLRVELWGWIAILMFIALVLFAELFNTSIETVVNLSTPEYHPLAKRAKDVAAGAVLTLAVIAAVAGLAIYIDAFLRLIGTR